MRGDALRSLQVLDAARGWWGPGRVQQAEGERNSHPVGSLSRHRIRQAGARALPWLLALGLATVVLLQAGTPADDIVRYAAYWCLGVVLPGVLVARATFGTRANWPEDVAIGAVTGLGLEIACFAIWSALGLQRQLWLWPLLVAVVFAAAPGLRRHWRITGSQPLPPLWSWGVASAIGAGALAVRDGAFAAPLPPAGGVYYQDITWHLSIVHELTRSFPPQIPQVAGEMLRYHWFSHVHMAAAHLVSGAPVSTVVLRLWILPLLALTALVGAALARELSSTWWSGPVAAWTLVVLQGTYLLPVAGSAGVIFTDSPSQVYVVPLVLGSATVIVQALRGRRLKAGWAVLALILLVSAGGKPVSMPLVLAGTCLATLALLLQRRRQWRAALSVVVMVAVILPASLLYVAGSDGGSSRISLFGFLQWSPLYHHLTGQGFHPAASTVLPAGVNDLSSRSLAILALLLLVPLVANVGHLAPLVLVASRRLRRDPALWFIVGAVGGGGGIYLVLSHPSYSQLYFLGLANALAAVFGAWALAVAVPSTEATGRRVVAVLIGGTMIGGAAVTLARSLTPTLSGHVNSVPAVEASFVAPLAIVGAVAALGFVAWALSRRRVPGLRGWGLPLVLAALVLGGPAQDAMDGPADGLAAVAADKPVPKGVGYPISPSAAAAMAWIGQHTAADAVIATNRHCAAGPESPTCLSLAFWVSGLGGRRTVIEGWGYTSAAQGLVAPPAYRERVVVNDAVFSHPSLTTINRLRREYGASWLVADRSAGPVPVALGRLAQVRFTSGQVTIYELP